MKLSKKQIEVLYTFVRKKGLRYLDLQDEMVDHLANSIEDQINENPELTFENALQIEYKKFGVFGFDGVYVKRLNELYKKTLKMYFKHLVSFFKLPKIILSIFIYILLYHFCSNENYLKYVIYLVDILGVISIAYIYFWKFKELRQMSKEYTFAVMYQIILFLSSLLLWLFDFPYTFIDLVNAYTQLPWTLPLSMTLFIVHLLITNELLEKLSDYINESGLKKMMFKR